MLILSCRLAEPGKNEASKRMHMAKMKSVEKEISQKGHLVDGDLSERLANTCVFQGFLLFASQPGVHVSPDGLWSLD